VIIAEHNITQQSNERLEFLHSSPGSFGAFETLLADACFFSQDKVEPCECHHTVPYANAERQRHKAVIGFCRSLPELEAGHRSVGLTLYWTQYKKDSPLKLRAT